MDCIRQKLAAALLFVVASATVSFAIEGDRVVFPSVQQETDRLQIHAATDVEAIRPLLLDFQQLFPGVALEYVDYLTNDLFRDAERTCKNDTFFADVLLSSSVDQLVKLANDGCASPHVTPSTSRVPEWANWREEVYGFTFEPAVIIYDNRTVPPEDVPRTHDELADLLRMKPETYRARVGTYDIQASGIGYLLAYNDSRQAPTSYGRLLESLSRADAITRCCNNEVLAEFQKGNIRIAYNILGSYAYAAHLKNPALSIVLPRDYTLILSRGIMIPRRSTQKRLAGEFIDYLLSPRGQTVARKSAFFFSEQGPLPSGVDGSASMMESGVGRPIRIGPALLAAQDRAQRSRFIADWSSLMSRVPSVAP